MNNIEVGSSWWKFDFHSHTPASDDYGKGPNQQQHKNLTPKEWLLNYMRAGFDCVAITDHNSGAWVDRLKEALHLLETEANSDHRPIYLFPGVEITVPGNIHILAIFGPEKSTSDIDSLLGAVKYRATKGKSDGCSECPAVEVFEEIVKAGGLAIPAHVDQVNGLFTQSSGNTLEQILDSKSVFAMEVIDTSQPKPALYTGKSKKWAEVLGTDAHHPSGTNGQCFPGSHYTWVKMSEPSYEGLRLALIDGALSLKRSDSFSGNPNAHSPLSIESITVNDAKYLGMGQPFDCRFNPWLNTVIGGRGTGKSTSLEFLRIALGRQTEIPTNLEKEFVKYGQISRSREDEGLLRDSTVITVLFRKDGRRFRIVYSKIDNTHRIEEETEAGIWSESEGDISQRFPIRIYSQKQIFELAKHPQALLRVIIDDAVAVNYRDWNTERDELTSKYLSIRAQEREVEAGLQEESVIRGHLNDIKQKLEVFEKAGHANVLKAFQLSQNQSKAIASWEKSWGDFADNLIDASELLIPDDFDLQHFDAEKPEDKQLIVKIAKVEHELAGFRVNIKAIAGKIDQLKVGWEKARLDLSISTRFITSNKEYAELIEQLTSVGAGDPSEYSVLVKQKQSLEERIKGFAKKREKLDELRQNSQLALSSIEAHRLNITRLRRDFLQETVGGNSYVNIDVIPFGNRYTLEEEFRDLIGRNNGGFERDIGTVGGDEGLLAELHNESTTPLKERIVAMKTTLLEIHSNAQAAIGAARDRRFVSHIQGLSPEQIDRIRCWFPDDSLDVKYSLRPNENFKPVEQGSPGQKTAALLAFILSYGDEPLLLDQPEDDLDNHLIYDLIVTHLREIKQSRQVLIVTHNANIVVNGDAENVIALDVRSGQTRIIAQGGLQEQSIRDEICTVMEGGREAFDQRYKRINAGR